MFILWSVLLKTRLLLYAFYCVPWSFAPWWSLHLRLRLQRWLSWFLVGRFLRWMLVFRRKIQRILRRLSTRRLRSGVNARILNLPKKVETSLYSDRIWCLTRKSLWFDIFGVQTADTPFIGMSFLTLWDDHSFSMRKRSDFQLRWCVRKHSGWTPATDSVYAYDIFLGKQRQTAKFPSQIAGGCCFVGLLKFFVLLCRNVQLTYRNTP